MPAKKRYFITAKCYDKKNNLISTGTNSYTKSHPLQAHFAKLANCPEKTSLHAEIHAIVRAKDSKVHKIVIERYDAEGYTALAKPCPVCQEAIKAFGIKLVQYTTADGFYTESANVY